METLVQAVGWILAIFFAAAGAIILWKMWQNKINLEFLISEPSGHASLSRFQFLVFTFVIAMGLFLITLRQSPLSFPDVPPTVLALLGISAGSYVVSKGIQVQRDTRMAETNADVEKVVAQTGLPAPIPSNGAAKTPEETLAKA
jgi:hypothetical protein